jgi:hypothetical protein
MSELPATIQRLSAQETEDLLCLYKSKLRGQSGRGLPLYCVLGPPSIGQIMRHHIIKCVARLPCVGVVIGEVPRTPRDGTCREVGQLLHLQVFDVTPPFVHRFIASLVQATKPGFLTFARSPLEDPALAGSLGDLRPFIANAPVPDEERL